MKKSLANPKTDAQMLRLRASGRTQEAIAKALGCCTSTVCKRLEELRAAGVTKARAQIVAAEAERKGSGCSLTPAQLAAQLAMRRCLGGCGQMFESTHAGNRICQRCQPRRHGVTAFTPDQY